MKDIVLTEATKNASKNKQRKYKCPYCETRLPKEKLITHIEKNHADMIGEDYTAARIVFNMINKKECGHCVQCKKETQWNEDTWRYERFCSEECSQEYSKIMKQRMIKTYGKEHLLNDPDQQIKMLKNRHISGTYKFKDGGRRDYCGSYEHKLLEFFDKVMNVQSKDIITPGPTIEYKYNGENLFWITDLYYAPANLVFDVKDGGDNPNTREMPEYREKQFAKEQAISEMNQYNYIRLTNNNFEQLLLILAEIKANMLEEDNPDYIIRINEFMVGTMKPVNQKYFLAKSMIDNVFVDTYAFIGNELSQWYKVSDNKLVKCNPLNDVCESYHIFEYKGNPTIFENMIKDNLNKEVEYDKEYFYETLTGKELYSNEQIIYDKRNFKIVPSVMKEYMNRIAVMNSTVKHFNELSVLVQDYDKQEMIKNKYPNLELRCNWNGYFAKNTLNECVSPYVKDISELDDSILEMLNS